MKRADLILNVPAAVWARAKQIEIPKKHKAIKALNSGLEAILLEKNIYTATDYVVAIGNRWCDIQGTEETSFFMATEWHRYAKANKSPTEFNESFRNFLLAPKLLIVCGLSYMKTKASRESMDNMLNRRVQDGNLNLIAGWNLPEGEFVFEVGQELASDSRSEFPLLHQRSGDPKMVIQFGGGKR